MLSLDDARSLILKNVFPLDVEMVGTEESLGRVIAEDVIAPRDMPRYDNSAMDGFAVHAADCAGSAALRVAGYIPAGGVSAFPLEPGTAIRIMTGAPIPAGCDAVIPFEQVELKGESISPAKRVVERQHVRFAGEDVKAGEVIVPAHSMVRPVEISMIVSNGYATVPVFRRPRVAIVSTGDELLGLSEELVPGKVFNSNSYGLAAAAMEVGAVPEVLGVARDTLESHREKLARGLAADVLITSAGVSAGDRDLVREVFAELGVQQQFWGVDIRPGGPTAFGVKDGKPVFCLPGNPVAALLTFEAFVRPALLKMMGHKRIFRRSITAILQDNVKKTMGKTTFLRVRLLVQNGSVLAYSAGDQNTGMLKTMLRSDGIALLSADRNEYKCGDEVEVQLLSNCLSMIEP